MMRRLPSHAVLLTSLFAIGLLSPTASAQELDAHGEAQMLERLNAVRGDQGLAPLTRHDSLDAAARAHSFDMAVRGELTHVSEQSGTPADRVRAAGVTAQLVAENVALHRSAPEAHETLVGSEAHLANMMNADITHVGLGAVRTDRGVYVTQVFATLAAPAPAELPPPVLAAPVPAPAEIEAPSELEREEGAPLLAEPGELPPDPEDPLQNCTTPLPGVRLCGRGASPSVQRVEPSNAAPMPVAPDDPAFAPSAPGANLHIQPGSNGTVIIERTADGARVEAYWVYGSGRWWYYPMPAGAQGGQRLQPDLRVSGPPPGFPAHPHGESPQTTPPPRPRAWQVAPPAPSGAQVRVAPGTVFYSVPPPPMVGTPDRDWRRAHRSWTRAYRRWLREQARLRQQAL